MIQSNLVKREALGSQMLLKCEINKSANNIVKKTNRHPNLITKVIQYLYNLP